ncbi:MAG TPA: hydroxysqualene dehydroxylase HpnE [Candidatus Sulfotelmatobacter sp.]
MPPTSPQPTVAIAGGGLAGLAAACALSNAGFRVTLLEKRPFLGGRASSYEHPGTGEVIDNCQHVLFRSCTNLIEFYRRIGVDQNIRWYDTMTFIEPGGRSTVMRTSMLPAPLHTAPSFWSFPFLTLTDKLAIARAMIPLMLTQQRDDGRSFQQWLDQHGQSQRAIENFWKPILISALSEDLDRVSISSAAQVVRVSMMSPAARHMGVPAVPLTELYDAAGEYIRARGGELHFRRAIESFASDDSQAKISSAGGEENFDYLILALPFDALERILIDTPDSALLREKIAHFETSPITGIHLWFDRQITDLDHAVLLNRTIQWMFHKSRLQQRGRESGKGSDAEIPESSETTILYQREAQNTELRGRAALQGRVGEGETAVALAPEGSYIELVVSASKSLIEKSRSEIVNLALAEVREFFPGAREATLVKSTVVKELHATYSPRPAIDAYRPASATPWPRVFLAGDWTATGWPATMEGAVRSGYIAAEAIARAAGLPRAKFLAPDLSPTGLMRLFQ